MNSLVALRGGIQTQCSMKYPFAGAHQAANDDILEPSGRAHNEYFKHSNSNARDLPFAADLLLERESYMLGTASRVT